MKAAADEAELGDLVAEATLAAVVFSAKWSRESQALVQALEAAELEAAESAVVLVAVDMAEEEGMELAAHHGVTTPPTVHLYARGRKVQELVGLQATVDTVRSALKHLQPQNQVECRLGFAD
jgi:thioredoxin-like negative regulator of GroEL